MLAMHDLTKLSGAETKPLPQSEDGLELCATSHAWCERVTIDKLLRRETF